jgi:hypothetical protein
MDDYSQDADVLNIHNFINERTFNIGYGGYVGTA